MVSLTQEQFEQYIRDIQAKIDDVDKASKEKAANIIKAMTDSYNLRMAEKIAEELQFAEKADAVGDRSKADQHRLCAEIFRSVLSVTK